VDWSLILSATSVAVTILVAVWAVKVTRKMGREAEDSLRDTTRVAILTSNQILRHLSESKRPNIDDIVEVGADIWGCRPIPLLIEPGQCVSLVAEIVGTSSPLFGYSYDAPDLRCIVVAPSSQRTAATAKNPNYNGEPSCEWRVRFPDDFTEIGSARAGSPADTSDEGIYRVSWNIDDANYGNELPDSFVVLKRTAAPLQTSA